MSANAKTFPMPDGLNSGLDDEIAESLKDPEYRAAFEDSNERDGVIDVLVATRKARGLTQTEVARRMGVGQSTVSGFENEGSDPRLSTIQRYARAVESQCSVTIHQAVNCDWVQPAGRYESSEAGRSRVRVDSSQPSPEALRWAAADTKRSHFALAA